jgi:hypothetical protein
LMIRHSQSSCCSTPQFRYWQHRKLTTKMRSLLFTREYETRKSLQQCTLAASVTDISFVNISISSKSSRWMDALLHNDGNGDKHMNVLHYQCNWNSWNFSNLKMFPHQIQSNYFPNKQHAPLISRKYHCSTFPVRTRKFVSDRYFMSNDTLNLYIRGWWD